MRPTPFDLLLDLFVEHHFTPVGERQRHFVGSGINGIGQLQRSGALVGHARAGGEQHACGQCNGGGYAVAAMLQRRSEPAGFWMPAAVRKRPKASRPL